MMIQAAGRTWLWCSGREHAAICLVVAQRICVHLRACAATAAARHAARFVGSLRKVGFTGDIVLATNAKLDARLKEFLVEQRVICYPLFVKCKSKLQCAIEQWFTPIEGTLPMAIIRHYLYLSWVQHYGPSSLISVLDFRDTVFQSDPFLFLEKELEEGATTDLWLSGEHMPYVLCHHLESELHEIHPATTLNACTIVVAIRHLSFSPSSSSSSSSFPSSAQVQKDQELRLQQRLDPGLLGQGRGRQVGPV